MQTGTTENNTTLAALDVLLFDLPRSVYLLLISISHCLLSSIVFAMNKSCVKHTSSNKENGLGARHSFCLLARLRDEFSAVFPECRRWVVNVFYKICKIVLWIVMTCLSRPNGMGRNDVCIQDIDGHECLVRDNSLTRSPSAIYSWCPLHGSVFSTIVSAHQSVGKTFLPVDRQERTLGHQTSFLSVVSQAR